MAQQEDKYVLTTAKELGASDSKLIYTSNAVEGFHRMLRKHTKNKTSFLTDDSLRKSIDLSVQEITKKWNMPLRYWGTILGQIGIFFEDELAPSICS